MDTSIPQKRCYKCKELKDRTTDNFGPDKRTSDGFRSICRPCRHTEYEESLARNPDMHKEKHQKLMQNSVQLEKHHARVAAYMRDFRDKKREAGLCAQCGVNPCEPGHYCATCNTNHLKYKGHYREKWPLYGKKDRDKLRSDVIEAYGSACQCCGESTYEFLTIDHVNNDGYIHRRSVNNVYRWLRKNGYPKEGFQILCYNCNCAKAFNGYCPHQRNS